VATKLSFLHRICLETEVSKQVRQFVVLAGLRRFAPQNLDLWVAVNLWFNGV
jgi:hypothetical protein